MRVQDWPREAQLLWAAGLYEGEGTAYASWNYQRAYRGRSPIVNLKAQVRVKMTDHDCLRYMQKLFGGGICSRANGKQYLDNPHWKPIWEWRLSGRTAVRNFIKQIAPYMCTRRREQLANVMLALYVPDRDSKCRTREDYLRERAERARLKECSQTAPSHTDTTT